MLLLLLLLLPLIGIFSIFGSDLFDSINAELLAVVPVVVYSDAKASNDQIIKENKGKAGVYLIFFC
jgi:hypothetical protein